MIDPNKPYLTVTSKDGVQNVEAHNYRGKGCVKAVQEVQEMLGGTVVSKTDKPEISLSPVAVNTSVQAQQK